jgi:hypothetical protein
MTLCFWSVCLLCRVRRALENTCKPVGGGAPDAPLTYGKGLLQVRGLAPRGAQPHGPGVAPMR